MRKTTRDRLDIARAGVLICVLGVSGIIALAGGPRFGFGHTPGNQDPAIPPSPPAVSLAPDSIDFGNQVVGRTSAAKRITVRNTGDQPLSIDSVDLGGDNPTAFAILKDTCTGATVSASRACVVDVTFTPSRTAERNARLRLNDNAPDSPQRVRLTGIGINSQDVAPF